MIAGNLGDDPVLRFTPAGHPAVKFCVTSTRGTSARANERKDGDSLFLTCNVWRERRVTDPVVDLRLFRDRSYTVGVTVITLYFAAFTPLFFIFTLLL